MDKSTLQEMQPGVICLITLTNLDLNLQYDLEVSGRTVLLSMDVFNVLNSARISRFNENGDTDGGSVEPNYGLPLASNHPVQFD